MKRIVCAIAICLVLCGCTAPAEETTQPTRETAVIPTEPAGSYLPGSALEVATGGAVREYPQNAEDIWAIRAMGEDVLVFSGYDTMTLTRLTGDNLFPVAQTDLPVFISADASSLCIAEDWLIYYDYSRQELVYLDEALQEISRIAMPEDILGEPVLTENRSQMYYCTPDGLRVMEMDTGISRLVKEMYFSDQRVEDLIMRDSIVRVAVMDEDGWTETLFLDAKTGAMQGGVSHGFSLASHDGWYYASVLDGLLTQMIFGNGESVFQLQPTDYWDEGFFLPESHSAVVYHWEDENLTLEYYDLSTARKVSAVELGQQYPGSFVETESGMLYFLAYDQDGLQTICRWDISETPTGDEAGYVGPWYTMDNPDEAGLEECRQYVRRLGEQHGLEIRIDQEAVDTCPQDYEMTPEYQVPLIRDALTRLEEMLAHFPQGFFETALSDMEDSSLTICLVRSLWSSPVSGYLTDAEGIQYWADNRCYVALELGENLEHTFYNEIFHAMEPRLLSNSIACYRWDELNPKGFDYDYDYIANETRDGSAYLEETTRSFIDTYSMSFPKEDRARVMEYACIEGNENYFISYTMQKKLLAICEGIREAYGLTDYPEELLWEQYLDSPITP